MYVYIYIYAALAAPHSIYIYVYVHIFILYIYICIYNIRIIYLQVRITRHRITCMCIMWCVENSRIVEMTQDTITTVFSVFRDSFLFVVQ